MVSTSSIRALQFDHINGGGIKDKERFHTSQSRIRYYLNHPDHPRAKLQVFCANCNWIKRAEKREIYKVHDVQPFIAITSVPRKEKAKLSPMPIFVRSARGSAVDN